MLGVGSSFALKEFAGLTERWGAQSNSSAIAETQKRIAALREQPAEAESPSSAPLASSIRPGAGQSPAHPAHLAVPGSSDAASANTMPVP